MQPASCSPGRRYHCLPHLDLAAGLPRRNGEVVLVYFYERRRRLPPQTSSVQVAVQKVVTGDALKSGRRAALELERAAVAARVRRRARDGLRVVQRAPRVDGDGGGGGAAAVRADPLLECRREEARAGGRPSSRWRVARWARAARAASRRRGGQAARPSTRCPSGGCAARGAARRPRRARAPCPGRAQCRRRRLTEHAAWCMSEVGVAVALCVWAREVLIRSPFDASAGCGARPAGAARAPRPTGGGTRSQCPCRRLRIARGRGNGSSRRA